MLPLFFFALVLFSLFACTALNDEGMALLDFRKEVTRDPSGALATWNSSDASPCSWTGVVCDQAGNASRILLQGRALSGTISSELSRLNHLRTIVLSDNSFSGSIPAELALVTTLWKLNVSDNALSGTIPKELGALASLRMLDMSGNTLSGSIPASLFSSCGRLRYVDFSNNNFTGSVPVLLGSCGRLEGIDVSNNLLSGSIPEQLGDLTSLQYIAMSSNAFSGSLPESLTNCTALKFLNFSGNQFSGSIPSQLSRLTVIQTIDLSSNNLSGQIPVEFGSLSNLSILRLGSNPAVTGIIPPEIGNILDLVILDLQRMNLQGSIPVALANCRFLLELDFSNNNLTGIIPASLRNATFLRLLDLESNKLSGSIPEEFGNLTNLQHLDLSINQLSGRIPSTLGNIEALLSLNVSFNGLSGVIPRNGVLQRFNVSSFLGNAGLCGAPLEVSCSSTAPASSPLPLALNRKTHVLGASAIAAIVATAVIALGLVVVCVLNCRALRKITEHRVVESTPPSPESSPKIVGKLVLFSKTLQANYEDWEAGSKALLDKDRVVGSGTLGTVYRVNFDAGVVMAVKKLETLGRIQNQMEFEEEIGRLANVRHPNVVLMQGYFWSSTTQLLLSDFIPNGSLFNHLHQQAAGFGQLTWKRRFKIALGTAQGLAYLHHDLKPPVVHFDLTSSNILLDHNFKPQLSDYGLSKLLPMLNSYVSSRRIYATLGYMAPELASQSIQLSEKCDVYSFGVILLELSTGRHPVENAEADFNLLCNDVRSALERGRGPSCIDSELGTASQTEVMQVLKLGLVCTSQIPSKRPSMAEVVQVLESIKYGNDL